MKKIPHATAFLVALGLWLAASTAWAAGNEFPAEREQNWHQWRGPLANGVAPLADPPTQWDENTNIKWKIKVPGESTATPVIWGDRIFLASAVKTDRTIEPPEGTPTAKSRYGITQPVNYYQFVVICIDRRTGKTLWQQVAKEAVPHEGHHPDGSFASASPMTDGKNLYVSFGSRGVYCFDLEGNPKWSRDLGRMKVFNTFGEGSSPVVYGDTVIVDWDHQLGSFIIALDAKTGETQWKVGREESSTWATPLVVQQADRMQVVVSGSRRVRSYDLKTGELVWACGGQTPSAIPCPVSDGKNVYCMSGFLGNSVYAIPLDSNGDITEFARKTEAEKIVWKRNQPGAPYVPSPLLYGDLLYFLGGNKGILTCLNSTTGEPVIDRTRLEGISNIYASPIGAADRVYFTSREGNTLVIKKGPQLEILATNKLDDRFDASAAAVGNELFLRGRENLYCISTK